MIGTTYCVASLIFSVWNTWWVHNIMPYYIHEFHIPKYIYDLRYTSSARKILRCASAPEFSSALFRKTRIHLQMVKAVVCDCPFEWAPFKSYVCMISMCIWQQKVNSLSSATTTSNYLDKHI